MKPRDELPPTPARHLPPIAQSTPMPLHPPKGPPRVTAPAAEPLLQDLKPKRDSLDCAYRVNALKHDEVRRREERRDADDSSGGGNGKSRDTK